MGDPWMLLYNDFGSGRFGLNAAAVAVVVASNMMAEERKSDCANDVKKFFLLDDDTRSGCRHLPSFQKES